MSRTAGTASTASHPSVNEGISLTICSTGFASSGAAGASGNARGRLYLHRGVERTYTKDLLVEVYLNGVGNGLSH